MAGCPRQPDSIAAVPAGTAPFFQTFALHDLDEQEAVAFPLGKPRRLEPALYEVDVAARPDDDRALGVHMNVGQVATSDGVILRMPVPSRLVSRHRRQQRVAARRRKGSRRRRRMIRRAARTARKLAMRRRDWQHRVSRRRADRAATLGVEDLRVPGMTASAKGTAERPGNQLHCKRRRGRRYPSRRPKACQAIQLDLPA